MKKRFSLSEELSINNESIEKIRQCIKITLGPNGKSGLSYSTKEKRIKFLTTGLLLLKSLEFSNPCANTLVRLLEQAAIKTGNISGDGSTMTILLSCIFLKSSLPFLTYGYNSVFLSNGLKKIAYFAVDKTFEFSNPISNYVELIGILKTNLGKKINDSIFSLLESAITKVGRDGLFIVEENISSLNEFEIVQGIELDKGFYSSYFINNLKNFEVLYDNPYLLIANSPITSVNQIAEILDYIKLNKRPLVIIAEEINKDVISSLILNNLQKKMKVVVIKYTSIKFMKTGILEDLALLSHSSYSTMESANKIFEISDLGYLKKAIIKKDKSTFFISKFGKLLINRRINELNRELLATDSEYEKNLYKTRIARLSGQIGKIKIGNSSQYEIDEIKQKIQNLINTVKATLEEGFVPGGASSYLYLKEEVLTWSYLNLVGDEIFAGNIVFDSLSKPFEELASQNLSNFGNFSNFSNSNTLSVSNTLEQLNFLGYPYAYNLVTNKIVNAIEDGLIDSTKSIRASLWNSLTLTSVIITTE